MYFPVEIDTPARAVLEQMDDKKNVYVVLTYPSVPVNAPPYVYGIYSSQRKGWRARVRSMGIGIIDARLALIERNGVYWVNQDGRPGKKAPVAGVLPPP